MSMTRALPRTLSTTLAALALTATAAMAQSNAERASQLNDQGKQLMGEGKFAEASEAFRQATLLSPEGRFYFNLCVSQYQQGKFGESLTSCNAVNNTSSDAKLKDKATRMIDKINGEMARQGIDPNASSAGSGGSTTSGTGGTTSGTDGTTTGGAGGSTTSGTGGATSGGTTGTGTDPSTVTWVAPPQGAPPDANLTMGTGSGHEYTWTLGGGLVAASTSFGGADYFAKQAVGFRLVGDYLLSPRHGLGLQASIGYLHNEDTQRFMDDTLDLIEIGVAGYKHLCTGRLCITPLLGVQVGVFQPSRTSGTDGLLALGVRGAAQVGYALGNRKQHLLWAEAGGEAFAAPSGDSVRPEDIGLDEPARLGYFSIGYTLRFNTPFGSSPFVTLE
jgi:hypothetical protein